jgi:hypothetical protein
MPTLFQDFQDQRITLKLPNGYSFDHFHAIIRDRIKNAVVHTLAPEATAMAAQVAMSKPSSFVSALDYVRLPFEETWIEYRPEHARDAMKAMGSPMEQRDRTAVQPRIGVFASQTADKVIHFLFFSEQVGPAGQMLIEPAVRHVVLDLTDDGSILDRIAEISQSDMAVRPDPASVTGKLRQHFRIVDQDPAERRALIEAYVRIDNNPINPLAIRHIQAMSGLMGIERSLEITEKNGEEHRQAALMTVIPALVLLACRNAVDIERKDVPEKLQKARLKRGRSAIPVVHQVTSRFTRYVGKPGDPQVEADERRAALVRGHFKIRRGGIFWWSPHARRGHSEAGRDRIIRL